VVKHRQLARQIGAFSGFAFESLTDLKINIAFPRINLLLGIFCSISGISLGVQAQAELKPKSEVQFSVSANRRFGANVQANKKYVLL
jgi:hypothetical protein